MGYYKMKGRLATLFLLVSIGAFISAYAKSDFTEERRFPSSINYVLDLTDNKAFYATYNTYIDSWLAEILGENPKPASVIFDSPGSGKYGSRFSYAKETEIQFVAPSQVYTETDTVINGERNLRFTVFPQRNVGDMVLLSPKETRFRKLNFNGQEVEAREGEEGPLADRNSDYLLSYRLGNREPLEVSLTIAEADSLSFTLLDFSYDLLENPDFGLPSRPANSMPMPFVNTDALITIQDIQF